MAMKFSVLRVGGSLPPGRFVAFISGRGWVQSTAIIRLEVLDSMKKSNDIGNLRAVFWVINFSVHKNLIRKKKYKGKKGKRKREKQREE
jgi:hypothetical protein